jgi:hypothetical protein
MVYQHPNGAEPMSIQQNPNGTVSVHEKEIKCQLMKKTLFKLGRLAQWKRTRERWLDAI